MENIYPCNKDAWVSHETSHDKPQFFCQLCDVVYTRKDNLKRHIKDKHMKPNSVEKGIIESSSLPNDPIEIATEVKLK